MMDKETIQIHYADRRFGAKGAGIEHTFILRRGSTVKALCEQAQIEDWRSAMIILTNKETIVTEDYVLADGDIINFRDFISAG